MFLCRRQLRRWAARVLFLWVFGVGSGFANACLTQTHEQTDGVVSGHLFTALAIDVHAATEAGEANHVSSQGHHLAGAGHDESPGYSNCQDFCDKSGISIPPLKSALDLAQADALLPLVAAILYPVADCELVQWRLARHDGGSAPPITITLLRLAL